MTAEDLSNFIDLLSSDYFSKDSQEKFVTPIVSLPPKGNMANTGIAASLLVYTAENGTEIMGNNGGFHGTNSVFRVLTKPNGEKIKLVLLSNEVKEVGAALKALEKVAIAG